MKNNCIILRICLSSQEEYPPLLFLLNTIPFITSRCLNVSVGFRSNGSLSTRHRIINITNIHFIHIGLERGLEFLCILGSRKIVWLTLVAPFGVLWEWAHLCNEILINCRWCQCGTYIYTTGNSTRGNLKPHKYMCRPWDILFES
jgi:hypothetical protein